MTALPGRQLYAELNGLHAPITRCERAGHRWLAVASIAFLLVFGLMAGCGQLPGATP